MFKNLKIFTLVFLVCSIGLLSQSIAAQTDSPYSRYGLGKLKDHSVGNLRGMGGIGYGVSYNPGANPLNPASYAQVDSLSFVFDFGVDLNNTSFKDENGKFNKSSGGLEYVTILFPVSKKMGISFGILPFSSTGYKLSKEESTEYGDKEINYTVINAGSGGLSQLYLGMGYETPIKGLFLGFNASYLFGKLNHDYMTTSVRENSSGIQIYLPAKYRSLNVTTAKVDLAVQYVLALANNRSATFGAVYSPKINGTGALTTTTVAGDGGLTPDVVTTEVMDTGTPHMLGLGVSYGEAGKWLIGADFGYERWKGVRFTNDLNDGIPSSDKFNNRIKLAVGGEYRMAQYSRKYFEKIKIRGGLTYNNSYVNVNNLEKQPKGYDEYGATLGFGFPLVDKQAIGNRTSYLNINFEYKHLKPGFKSMVSENYLGVSVSMNINEFWFFQRKIK